MQPSTARQQTFPSQIPPTHLQSTVTSTQEKRETALPATATLVPTEPPVVINQKNVSEIGILHTLEGHTNDVTDAVFSPDGSMVATSSLDGSIRLWRTSDGGLVRVLEGHEDQVISLAFSPDGTSLTSASDDHSVRIWRVEDGSTDMVIGNDLMGRVVKVIYSPDGSLIAMAGHKCFVELRSTRSGMLRRTLAQPGCVAKHYGSVFYWGMAFSPDGSQLVTGEGRACCGGSLQLWQTEEHVAPRLIRGYDLVIRDLDMTSEGSILTVALVGSTDFWLLKLEEPRTPKVLEGHIYRVNGVAFSPDDQLVVSGSRDAALRLWLVETGEMLAVLEGHADGVNNVAFSDDGSMIASASEDDTAVLWGLR